MSGPSSSSRSRAACGVRTVTAPPPARATNSSTVVSAISRPRPITTSRVAVSAISLIRCEDTNTVRPSAARPLSRFLIHSTPSGSSPLTGSSRTTTPRIAEQRGRDAQPLAHPQGEPAGPLAGHLTQADHVDHLIDPALADAVGLGQRQQVVAGRPAGVHRPGLQQDAQLGHRRRTPRGNPCRLPGPGRRWARPARRSSASWWTSRPRSGRENQSRCRAGRRNPGHRRPVSPRIAYSGSLPRSPCSLHRSRRYLRHCQR